MSKNFTTLQNRKYLKVSGFLKRTLTKKGKHILKNRRQKGRHSLTK